MASGMKEFEHLKIDLKELKEATNNFGGKVIGTGGFGKVYEGEVSHSKGRSVVAIKRLSRKFGQGDPEFLKEIMMLSRYTHQNLISLLGFCDEDGEKILVYEHASNGSLDRHLSSTTLTWTQRLKTCLDAARGLAYLHDHKGTQQRVLHRDIKSANILLDENWNAKISDMGFSKIGPANQQHTMLFTNVVGTPGYCDPQYMYAYTLTKESDVYSFGVVLFEVLCGRLCFNYSEGGLEILVPMWKQSYEHKKLDQIIFKDIMPPLDPTCLKTFSDTAFQCLDNSREQRPTASLLVEKLETALNFQRHHDIKLADLVDIPLRLRHADQLIVLLYEGKRVILNNGQTERKGAKLKDAEGGTGWDLGPDKDLFSFTAYDLLTARGRMTGKSTYVDDYKATLENGEVVAVKRLKRKFTLDEGFKLRYNLDFFRRRGVPFDHPNLMATRGYCLDPKGDKLLVLDYMPNGRLNDFLCDPRPRPPVDWPTRMQIAKGVARGLHTLHTRHNIIHGFLTSCNVWLDENLNPKISDFWLPWFIRGQRSNIIATARILGYQAPEVPKLKEVDEKVDVYSLGVIMLELITGKSPSCLIDYLSLPQWVALTVKEDWSDVIDSKLMVDTSLVVADELVSTLKVALDCVHSSPSHRPDIHLVLHQLEMI